MPRDKVALGEKAEIMGRFWLCKGGKNFLGRGRVDLLERIGECGSIAKAARAVGMSYKAAWDAVDIMNRLSPEPLVVRISGGKDGGGTQLTEAGKRIIGMFRLMEREHREFMSAMTRRFGSLKLTADKRRKL